MMKTTYKIRLIIISIIGILISLFTIRFKYKNGIFDDEIYLVISVIAIIIWIVFVFLDIKQSVRKKNKKYLLLIFIGIVFLGFNLYVKQRIQSIFDKPTLLRVFYDGDFNGTGFDFKTDGTYIYDNWSVGFSDYEYGHYSINGDVITIDRNNIDNIIISKRLEIRHTDINPKENWNYLFQTDGVGKIIQEKTKFRVVIDNRNE